MKIFPGTVDRASVFSSANVCEEIGNQTKARKGAEAQYSEHPVSWTLRVQILTLDAGLVTHISPSLTVPVGWGQYS